MKKIFPFLVLPVFFGIVFYLHYFVYASVVYFFSIVDGALRQHLAILAVILALSFIATSALAHFFDNAVSRFLYLVSAVWLWLGTYLVFSLAGALLLDRLSVLFFFPIDPFFLGFGSFFVAFTVTVYGLWNATKLQITEIEVSIKDLPESWNNKIVVHLTDIHIGHILRQKYLKRIVHSVNRYNPSALFVTGDLFDGMDGRLEHLVDPLNEVQAEHGIFYVTGNHETYLGIERSLSSLRETKARILRDEVVRVDGLDIVGIDYPLAWEKKDIARTIVRLPGYQYDNPSILLYHIPVQIDAIAKTGINLELCGHTHKGQMFPFGFITKWMYRGYDYGLHTIGDYSLYTSSGVGTWGPPMRVATKAEIVVIRLVRK